MSSSSVHLFGIRHHGPGSAKSLRAALEALKPDCVLVEGPPDAGDALPLLIHAEMEPPVALLGYIPDKPKRAVYYPFAVFSPEWQALQYALKNNVKAAFIDLPLSIQFAMDEAEDEELRKKIEAEKSSAGCQPALDENPPQIAGEDASAPKKEPNPRHDPLRWLAEAAGFSDGERWWEHTVEHRRDGADMFAGILEAMTALRSELPPLDDPLEKRREDLREAHMRTCIRAAQKEKFANIAVVCGAWHTPALVPATMPPAKDDAALLKGLPKTKVQTTWIPWTYGRLATSSGYGAGIESPGWYHHLWTHTENVIEHWLTRVARLLRGEDLDASSAQTIEAVRLAEALAALRGRPLPGLAELNEAIQATFCFGGSLPLKLIHARLIVSETLGKVPESTPMVPLQQDLQREQKRLRLAAKASAETVEFDLRKENDLDKSRLLHRLALLDIPWGEVQQTTGKGTFKEGWALEWKPEFAVALIEAGVWGNTVPEAAAAFARKTADDARALPALTELIGRVFLADLPDAATHVMARLQNEAALATDVAHLMDALPPMAWTLRYTNVRHTDKEMVAHVVAGLIARICVGLPTACGSLNDEAAAEMFNRINRVHDSVSLLQDAEHTAAWQETLVRLADLPNLHGVIAGRAARLLLEAKKFTSEEAGKRLSLALSAASDPVLAAAWFEGFLKGGGVVLIHDETLWSIVDAWLAELKPDVFTQVLPLLRRTFCTFQAPERRQIGERAKNASGRGTRGSAAAPTPEAFDLERAEAVLPLLRQLLGI